MKKSIGKAMSMVLAAAMITSSFTATLSVGAATKRENGTLNVDNGDLFLASYQDAVSDQADLDTLLGNVSVETYDHEDLDTNHEFISFTHASGDRLVNIDKNGKLTVKKNVSGKEVITVTYEADSSRDDKDVTVRATKNINIYVGTVGTYAVGKAGEEKDQKFRKLSDVDVAAVNDGSVSFGIYEVEGDTNTGAGSRDPEKINYKVATGLSTLVTTTPGATEVKVENKTKNSKVFDSTNMTISGGVVTIPVKTDLKTATETFKVTLPAVAGVTNSKSETVDIKLQVAKKWRVGAGATEINKKNGKTYVGLTSDPDWDNWSKDETKKQSISGYDIISDHALTIKGGSVGAVEVTTGGLTVEAGTTGDIKAADVTVEGGSTGIIKDKATTVDVSGGKVKQIDADDTANISITGGTVGDVKGTTISIDADDDEVSTTVGNIVSKGNASATSALVTVESTSDAAVKVGNIKAASVSLRDDNSTIGAIDLDYYDGDEGLTFEGFGGKVASVKNADNAVITLNDDAKISLDGKLIVDSVEIEDGSRLTVAEAEIGSVSGEGTLAFPAGKLFIEDGVSDETTFQVTSGLAVGATIFQSYSDAVAEEDFTALGYTVERKAVNDDKDKFVVKAIEFAGLAFDKENATVAKGNTATINVANYPTSTAMPKDASILWEIEGNDDYITMTVDSTGMVATVKVLDYNTSYNTDNMATVTATVVDADGNVYDEYVAAECKVTGVALPESTVTLDTKTVSVGTGNAYQFIAKSSTGSIMTATSSDTQIATVALYDSKDSRGYKFQVNGVAEGKATITVTDANQAVATMEVNVVKVNGTLKADTTSLKMAPGAIYDAKFTVTGSTATPVVTCNGNVAKITNIGGGKYRITAVNPGTAWVVATVGNARVTITVNVAAGQALSGVTGNNVSNL